MNVEIREQIERINTQVSMIQRAQNHYSETHSGCVNNDLEKTIQDLLGDKEALLKRL